MKIKVTFRHHKKNKIKYASISSYFYGANCSDGPVIERDKHVTWKFDFKEGDEIQFCTTKFEDEFDLIHKRRGRVVNGVSEAKVKRNMAKYKRDIKSGKIEDPFKKRNVLDMKKLKPTERKKVRRMVKKAKDIAKHQGVS